MQELSKLGTTPWKPQISDFSRNKHSYFLIFPYRDSKHVNYFGKLNLQLMTEWLLKRSKGSFTNKLVIKTKDDLERKTRTVDNLVVYYGAAITTTSSDKTSNKGLS